MAFEVGQRIGDYEVLQMLGAGGMGHVYRVRNVISNRIEAMKVLLPDLAAEPDLAVRFISEIRTLASFDHPNIALLHTAFQADNQLVMMMEFVEGFTLEHRGRQSLMPGGEVVQIISQTLSALSYAHARGVVHRDIKPANIMVTSHGIAKLMDFGIAKSKIDNNLTRPGTTMGSLYYMSPEQVRGTTVDARSDIYSIGIVLYELLAGNRPFESDTTFGILNQQLNVQPRPPIEVNPSLPRGLNDIILTALAKDPADRFQSADAFRNALKTFVSNPARDAAENVVAPPAYAAVPRPQPAPASPLPSVVNQPRATGNKPLWIATGAIAAVLALVAVAVAVPHYMHTRAASSGAPNNADPGKSSAQEAVSPPAPNASTPPSASDTTQSIPTPSPTATPPPAATDSGSPSTTKHVELPRAGIVTGGKVPRDGGGITPPVKQQTMHAGAAEGASLQAAQPAANGAELEQLQDHLVQLNARASSARHSVQQIRSQQEQMGVGMRGDVEAAESRLDAYLRAAHNDLQSGNTAAAARDLDRADTELGTLDRFLGH